MPRNSLIRNGLKINLAKIFSKKTGFYAAKKIKRISRFCSIKILITSKKGTDFGKQAAQPDYSLAIRAAKEPRIKLNFLS